MKISSTPLLPRLTVFMFWVGVCLSAYWDSLPKALLFGIGFGFPIWTDGFLKKESRVTRKVDAIILGAFALVFISLILVFQVFENPLLTAGLIAGFFSAVIAARWFFGDYSQDPNTIAEQDEDPKPDDAPS